MSACFIIVSKSSASMLKTLRGIVNESLTGYLRLLLEVVQHLKIGGALSKILLVISRYEVPGSPRFRSAFEEPVCLEKKTIDGFDLILIDM